MPVPRPSYPMIPVGVIDGMFRKEGIEPGLSKKLAAGLTRILDKQAIDERLNYSWLDTRIAASGLRASTVIVAGANSTDAEKAGADIVCDGTADQVDIQAAVTLVEANSWGGEVLLLSGDYNFTGYVTLTFSTLIRGMGTGTYISGGSNDLFLFDDYGCALADMALSGGDVVFCSASASRCWISNVDASGRIALENSSRIANSYIGELLFGGGQSIAAGCVIGGSGTPGQAGTVLFEDDSYMNRMVGCHVSAVGGRALYLGGTSTNGGSNAVSGCTFLSNMVPNNTSETVAIDGYRNSFTDNVVRNSGVAGLSRPQYGVDVQAAATDARVKFNDLRATWGTAAYNDAGTATLASDNDT